MKYGKQKVIGYIYVRIVWGLRRLIQYGIVINVGTPLVGVCGSVADADSNNGQAQGQSLRGLVHFFQLQ